MKIRTFHNFIVFVMLIFVGNQITYADDSVKPNDHFISIADIHFNPFAGCKASLKTCFLLDKLRVASYRDWEGIFEKYGEKKISPVGQDTNYPLFKSTLQELGTVNQEKHPRFGLIIGDFLAHNFREEYIAYSHDLSVAGYQAFVKKTLQFMTYKIHQEFPNIDIYPTVGNNDSYTGDYDIVPQGRFYQETAETWAMLINDKSNQDNLLSDFPIGGYYAVTLPTNKHQRIIMLNTVLFSTRASGKHINTAAEKEFVWLHKQLVLAAAQNQHVLLAFHIPVGIDVYATVKSKLNTISEFWKSEYSEKFENELKHFSNIIMEILPAHIHMDTFQLVTLNKLSDIPVSFTPAVSPIFGNNPGFKLFSYNSATFRLENFITYYYQLTEQPGSQWQQEYSFNQIYQPQCHDCNLTSGMQQLGVDNKFVAYYKNFYAVGNNTQPITTENAWLPYYWCNIRRVTLNAYKACLKT